VEYEVDRHITALELGTTPRQETRGWNETKNCTIAQRTKEDAEDYRYFPDPDIASLEFSDQDIQALRETLPELPAQTLAPLQLLSFVHTPFFYSVTLQSEIYFN
jgi:aspartyl-tRNA(Asn)/glutamyl-tRNA(Gln) amidotransferase subunit B